MVDIKIAQEEIVKCKVGIMIRKLKSGAISCRISVLTKGSSVDSKAQ